MRNGYQLKKTEEDGETVILRNADCDMDFVRFTQMIRTFAFACGYTQETIDRYIGEPE